MDAWLKPMLCTAVDDVPEGDEWVLERKEDGWRGIFHRDANGVRLYGGRNGTDYTGKVPYLEAMFHRLPDDTAIDGELIGAHGDNSVVQSVMFRNGEHDLSTSDPLRFVAFDITRCDGQDVRALTWTERRALLEQAGFNGPLVMTADVFESTRKMYEALLDAGAEGVVCKRIESKYTPDRSKAWVKIKPTMTLDAQVTGFEPGTKGSEFEGTLGALKIEIAGSGVKAKVGTGFDRSTRDQIWATRMQDVGSWLGDIIEVRCQSVTPAGKPKFPRFSRRRDDLMPAGTSAPGQPIASTKPKAAKPKGVPQNSGGVRSRNYKAMGEAKLVQSILEMRGGYGDATDRAERKHTGLANELALAEAVAAEKGVQVP